MSLNDYAPETAEVLHRDKVLCTVRGLNSEDVAVLMRNHVSDMRVLFAMWDNNRKLLPNSDSEIEGLAYAAITNIPATIHKLIAMASGEPGNLEGARRLSLPLQLKIVMAVIKLTFEDVGGPLGLTALLRGLANSSSEKTPSTSSGRARSEAPTIQ